MTRIVTRNQDKLFIPPGGIDFSVQTNKPGVVDIYLRAGDNTPGTGLHWHETHTEYLQVVQGYALVTVGDRTAVFSKDDGIITIPRYTIHQYMRADKTDEGKPGKDRDLIVREWTEPGDGDKEVFFRNMISLIMDKKDGTLGTVGMLLSVMTVCWSHDNYPVFWKGPAVFGEAVQQRVRRAVTFSLMGCLVLFGRLVGCKPHYPEYTP
ncbi:Dolichyl-phosphate-mannose mannosyltransferase 2 [Fusarium sp. NRRL 52700]|nr:Dolichyl-phosphate-mannose mannosyltransferase 2 [Fusarium sp. NRRL 52700]